MLKTLVWSLTFLDNGPNMRNMYFSEYNFTLSKRIGPNPNGSVNCEPVRVLIFRTSSPKMSNSSFRDTINNGKMANCDNEQVFGDLFK